MTTEELVTELRASRTDLARFVQAAHRDRLPFMVVGAQSVRAWEQREPSTWARVRKWLEAHSIALREV
jgi:hypothetical protein